MVLQGAGYFEQISFTDEDRKRGELYRSIAERNQVAAKAGDTDAFLRSLETVVAVKPFDPVGRKRIAQLISKSNQFNLTTRRYSEQEIEQLERLQEAVTMQIRLSDIFGDSGMISVIIAREHGNALRLDAWLMSCRVLNRRVEEAALVALVEKARERALERIVGDYLPTDRNGIVADHYQKLGFRRVADLLDGGSRWELGIEDHSAPDLPMTIEITD
jgi:FkbH-like protein